MWLQLVKMRLTTLSSIFQTAAKYFRNVAITAVRSTNFPRTRCHIAVNARNAGDAVAPCPRLPARMNLGRPASLQPVLRELEYPFHD
jgi:hypothetical protein